MLRIALRSLGARKLRSALTALAIVLGAAMIAGTYVLTDQVTGAFDEIFEKANKGVDVVLSRQEAFHSDQGTPVGPIPESLVTTVQGVDGVAAAEGVIQDLGSLVVDGKFVSSQGGAPNLVFSTPSERFQSNQLVDGAFPKAPGEIAVDVALAKREKLTLGQTVGLSTRTGVEPVRVVGTFKFGDSTSIGGGDAHRGDVRRRPAMVRPGGPRQRHRCCRRPRCERRQPRPAHHGRGAERRAGRDRTGEHRSPGRQCQ
jgi:putative ABC transport system permease protein